MIRYDSAQFWKRNIPWDNQHSGTNCGTKNIEHRRQSMNIMNISGVTQKQNLGRPHRSKLDGCWNLVGIAKCK